MEMFSALQALCEGNPPVTNGFPSQSQVTRRFDVFFDARMIKCWTNSGVAGDLGAMMFIWRHRNCFGVVFLCVFWCRPILPSLYNDVIMGAIASQITSLTIVFSTVYLDTDQRKHQSSASLAFVWGIRRRPVNSPHKWSVTRKMFPFDDVIMICKY